MGEHYQIAIMGSGPGGMSAGGRAAEHGVSHILLERSDHLSDTIFKYQKGKHVMATPDVLPLRSPMSFEPGTREAILGAWEEQTKGHNVNVRYNAEVTGIKGERGNFEITINNKETIADAAVILAIGLQGNLRKLTIDGADWERVQYQLDDPDEYEDETTVVIGAGDAAIENVIGLAVHNRAVIINRRGEFARVKDGNKKLIEDAIENGTVQCFYEANPSRITPGQLVLETKAGEEIVECDRIIARLGAIPPRKFVEACGIEFPSDDRMALPELSPQYESNVPGLYVIGALGGYPLIKQAMNQGYEVVEFILGNEIKPADEPLLEEKFGPLLDRFTVDEAIDWLRQSVPLISGLTALQLREFLLDSTVHVVDAGTVVFGVGDFGTTVFMIAEGHVNVHVDPDNPSFVVPLGEGKFFGEMAMVSARPRAATISAGDRCILVEAPRRTMIKLMNSVKSVKRQIREAAMGRQLRSYLTHDMSDELVASVLETAERRDYKPGQPLFHEGEEADGIYVIRKGSVTASRDMGGREVMLGYIPTGQYVGEVSVVGGGVRYLTARAATQVAATWVEDTKFREIMDAVPAFKHRVEEGIINRLVDDETMLANQDAGGTIQFLVDQGMGEATDILLIDESLCVGCNNCEKACAETHNGICRLNREAGPTFANIHVPTVCRHCEDAACMTDCPTNAIQRAASGQVFIDPETCIGCENCKNNCPYDAIHMSGAQPEKPGLLSWMFFGLGPGPGQDRTGQGAKAGGSVGGEKIKKAVKCDSCKDIDGGPACVRACPTAAVFRVSPEQFFSVDRLTNRDDELSAVPV